MGQGDRVAGEGGHALSSCSDLDAGSPGAEALEWEADKGAQAFSKTGTARSIRASEQKEPTLGGAGTAIGPACL